MIAGFEEVTSGEVEIDGRRIDRLAPAKRGVAMAFEGYSLYPPLSIRENIAYGVRDATDEQVWAAMEKADATDFIKTLEDAYGGKALDAQVGSGCKKLQDVPLDRRHDVGGIANSTNASSAATTTTNTE